MTTTRSPERPAHGTKHRDRTPEDLRRVARESFGWPELREGQLEAMLAVMQGRDVLAVMPTGYGKSALYQVPGLLLDGPTLVVSPLVALQRDQIVGIEAGAESPIGVAVNSGESAAEVDEAWDAVGRGAAEYLFLTPEQLAKQAVVTRLADLGVSLVVIDEAHCVSAWGHDFRPDYLRLAGVVDQLGHPPVVALTATAAAPVRDEIIDRVGLREPFVTVRGFDRPNIRLAVRRFVADADKRAAVVEEVAGLPTPGLLYVATRKDTTWFADQLAERGLRSAAYHGGMKAADRDGIHDRFLDGSLDVVVATSAFGMGIDKPDVRYVVHADAPDSLDSYYQQLGRCGRDGEPAQAVLFYRPEDLSLQRFFTGGSPDEAVLRDVLVALREAEGPVRITALQRQLEHSRRRVTHAVNLLEQAGAVSSGRRGLTVGDTTVEDAVAAAGETAAARQRMERSRLEMMRGYAETSRCRRHFLLGYFGEEFPRVCKSCDVCEDGGDQEDPGVGDVPFPLDAHVVHRDWGSGTVMQVEEDRLTVLFEQEGYRTLLLSAVQEEGLLALAQES